MGSQEQVLQGVKRIELATLTEELNAEHTEWAEHAEYFYFVISEESSATRLMHPERQ